MPIELKNIKNEYIFFTEAISQSKFCFISTNSKSHFFFSFSLLSDVTWNWQYSITFPNAIDLISVKAIITSFSLFLIKFARILVSLIKITNVPFLFLIKLIF